MPSSLLHLLRPRCRAVTDRLWGHARPFLKLFPSCMSSQSCMKQRKGPGWARQPQGHKPGWEVWDMGLPEGASFSLCSPVLSC